MDMAARRVHFSPPLPHNFHYFIFYKMAIAIFLPPFRYRRRRHLMSMMFFIPPAVARERHLSPSLLRGKYHSEEDSGS